MVRGEVLIYLFISKKTTGKSEEIVRATWRHGACAARWWHMTSDVATHRRFSEVRSARAPVAMRVMALFRR